MSPSAKIVATVMANSQGQIAYWNSTATSFFGFDSAETIGKSVEILIPPDYVVPHWEGFWRAMESGECKIDGAAFHLPVKCKDTVVRTFPARFVFLRDAFGVAAGAIVLFSPHSETAEPFSPVSATSKGE